MKIAVLPYTQHFDMFPAPIPEVKDAEMDFAKEIRRTHWVIGYRYEVQETPRPVD